MNWQRFNDPALKLKILDYTYTSEPSINTALPIKKSAFKIVLFIVGVILTFGFLWLVTKWSQKKKAIILYKICPLDEATHFLIEEEQDGPTTIVDAEKKYEIRMDRNCNAFNYHDRSYLFVEEKQAFVPIRYEELGLHLDKLKKNAFSPLREDERVKLLRYYGMNVIRLPVQSRVEIFIQEMLTPYEVFQTYGIVLWIYEEYYIFALILLSYSLYTYWNRASEVQRNQEQLSFQSYFSIQSKILIDQAFQKEGEGDIQLCTNTIKIDEHKSEIMKNNFNGIQSIDQEALDHMNLHLEMTVIKTDRRKSKEVKNQQNILINNKNVKFKTISSHELVPGDLIILNQGDIVPCDCILLRGQALVNEKYTTGESYLVRKQEIESFTYVKDNEKSFMLNLGTLIVKIKNEQQQIKKVRFESTFEKFDTTQLEEELDGINELVCLVTQTNFNTLRGKFLRAIRYQSKPKERFTIQTIYFIYIILLITTVAYFVLIFEYIGKYTSSTKLFVIYLDLLVTSIPPTLPTVLSVGVAFVLHRLKVAGIHCVLPSTIISGGRTNTIVLEGHHVFGKQYQVQSSIIGIKAERGFGLTFSSMDQYQKYIRNQELSYSNLQELKDRTKDKENFKAIATMFINAIASCHTLEFFQKSIEGSVFQKIIFQFSTAKNVNEDQFETETDFIQVFRTIRFPVKDQMLAVICRLKALNQEEDRTILSPSQDILTEKFSLLDDDEESVSATETIKHLKYHQIQEKEQFDDFSMINHHWKHSREKKMMFLKGSAEKILKYCSASSYPLNAFEYIVDMAEKGFILYCYAMKELNLDSKDIPSLDFIKCTPFTFLGFVVLQQNILPQNIEAIDMLKRADTTVILMSEERQLETASKAILNGLCKKNELLLCNLSRQRQKVYCKGHIEWESSSQNLYSEFLTEFEQFGKGSLVSIDSTLYEELYMKREMEQAHSLFDKIIVLNRMELKHEKNFYTQLERHQRVSFAVGGGGSVSECANISLELERESSSLLSSFHTLSSSLKCIVDCLLICRAGLSTNFHCFSMMILFSLIQFTTVVILYCNYQSMTTYQSLYEDLFITFPIFVTINMTLPAVRLSKELPPCSFFSVRNMTSMMGQLVIQFLTQFLFFVYMSKGFEHIKDSQSNSMNYYIENQEFLVNSDIGLVLFVLSNNLYLGIVLSTSVSKPFRKPFYTNPFYTANLVLLWVYNLLIVLFPNLTPEGMRPKVLHPQTEYILKIALIVGNLIMIVMYAYQNLLVYLFARCSKEDDRQAFEVPSINASH